jgi:hypothetical protein
MSCWLKLIGRDALSDSLVRKRLQCLLTFRRTNLYRYRFARGPRLRLKPPCTTVLRKLSISDSLLTASVFGVTLAALFQAGKFCVFSQHTFNITDRVLIGLNSTKGEESRTATQRGPAAA